MDHVPESSVDELLRWIAAERDAAWAAKLAILRVQTREDIALLAAHLQEHERHAQELAQLVRAAEPRRSIPTEPGFVTRDAHIIGALDRDDAVIEAMTSIEAARIARYERRSRQVKRDRDAPSSLVDALLERHLDDARARLAALERCRQVRSMTRHAAHAAQSGAAA
jgi:hypothetical protein